MEDFQIIKLFNERSEEAITETKNKYDRYCFSIARAIIGEDGEAEECVIDTYLKAWNSIPPAAPEKLSAYLGKITRNLAIHRYERKNAEKRGGGEVAMLLSELSDVVSGETNATREGSADSMTDALAFSEAMNTFLGNLKTEKRVIFVKRYWYASSVKEIASELGISESKVKMSLLRTREELRAHLLTQGFQL